MKLPLGSLYSVVEFQVSVLSFDLSLKAVSSKMLRSVTFQSSLSRYCGVVLVSLVCVVLPKVSLVYWLPCTRPKKNSLSWTIGPPPKML